MRFRLVVLLMVLLTCLSCDDSKYNFTLKADGLVLVKGNTTPKGIPSGHFKIYGNDGTLFSEGNYSNGVKSEEWFYSINGKEDKIDWSVYESDGYMFSMPSTWSPQETEGYVMMAYQYSKDSLIESRFIIKEHDYRKAGAESFKEYSNAYFAKIEEDGLLTKKANYTDYFAESFGNPNVTVYHYVGSDSSGDEISIFNSLVYNKQKDIVLEMANITPFEGSELRYRLFTDILLDVQYNNSPLFTKWGLSW